MGITVHKPGLLTTVQDLGRYGYQKQGVIVGGAMDKLALRLANLLLGNEKNAAALEITQQGPELAFEQETLIALGGADLSASINGERVYLWRPVLVKAGSVLSFGKPLVGNYAYLAVAGGLAVPEVIGSRATYLRAGIGGLEGRALRSGDVLHAGEPNELNRLVLSRLLLRDEQTAFTVASWFPEPELLPTYKPNPVLRALRGSEYTLFTENSQNYIWNEKFSVTIQSDRMGLRLQGAILALEQEAELLSTAVSFGAVQVPAEGSPIVLMADSQTTGGYPHIAQVISADLPQLAQVQPTKTIRFEEVTLEEAQRLYIQQEQNISGLKQAIYHKLHKV
ncbi:5-oxoprolinase subunit C family protein [Pontibacter akesuensis]|uniref:Antagonist of KipI n=1 Tax=Pontibacter akesuensis TaxID=388950 RepID=A0A1I7GQ97_9BACT|nr:biotin-dependent carboxyltransferase family protein [Pontibacter akesuensis]GHA55609.1 KipI antagonist [Pontibacter akesuensis]SFU50579.1 antagonist of KipI [Pontibacter akesuensis]